MEIISKRKVPEVVSLVALGHSKLAFFNETMTTGTRRGVADEVWVINKMAPVIQHDVLFRMDDLSLLYDCNNQRFGGGNVAEEGLHVHEVYTEFLKNHDKPIITSKAYPEFPTSMEYPLEEVINCIGDSYLRTTPAYAAAFAIYLGVKQLRIYGCDYVYPTNVYKGESGRANMEHILAIGMERGMDVFVPSTSTLLDTNIPPEKRMYGYKDPVEITKNEEGRFVVKHKPRLGEEIRNKRKLAERQQLQALMSKYSADIKRELIMGDWITHEDIDEVKSQDHKDLEWLSIKPPKEEVHNKEAPEIEVHNQIYKMNKVPDAPERAVTEITAEGD